MEVNLFVSNNSFDAVDEQIKLIGKGIESGIEQFVIVPDRFSLSAERLVMEKLNLTASFDFQVLSLSRLANLVIGKNPTKKVLSMLDAVMIVQFLLKKNKDKFVCFSSIPITTTFAQSLFDSISQLKSCKITPTMLKNSVEDLKDGNLKQKMQDIAVIYDLYENFIEQNFVDSNNKIGLLCEKLKSSQIFEGKDVHFCNFQDFTTQDFDVIKNSIKCAKSVSLTLKLPPKNQPNADCFLLDTKKALNIVFEELNLKPNIVLCKNTQTKANKAITENLFCLEPQKQEIFENEVQMFSAENLEEEVTFVAKKILWLVGQGEKFNNIVLNVCDLQTYQGILQNVFERYQIPFWMDQDVGLDTTELAKLFNALFDVVKFGYQTDDVLRLVSNGLVNLDEKEKQTFDFYAKKFGLVGTLWTKPLTLKNVDENLKAFDEKKLEISAKLEDFNQKTKQAKTLQDFCFAVQSFYENFELEKKCEELSIFFEKCGNLKQSSIFRQCPQKFGKILEQMSMVLGEEESTFDEFCDMFAVSLKTSTMVPLPMGTNSVFVGQMLSSMFEPKPYVFVLGATQDRLPAFMKDVGIISDSDIALLTKIDINPTIKQINQKTIETIIENLALAQKMLCLTYSRNTKSAETEPSQVLLNLGQMFFCKEHFLDIVPISTYLQDKNFFGSNKNLAKFLFPTKKDVLLWLLNCPDHVLQTPKAKEFLNLLEKQNFLNKNYEPKKFVKNAENLFFTKGFTSATQIEKFFDCPFKHFVEHGLKLSQKQTSHVDQANIGNILHHVVEKFSIFAKNKNLTENQIDNFATQIFDEICESEEYEHFLIDPQNKVLMKGLLEESKRICKALNHQNQHSNYKTKFVEASFGSKNFADNLPIKLGDGKRVLKLKGTVDRVDFCGSKFRVVDYKTGKTKSEFSMKDLYFGSKLQLFIYMKAIFQGMNNVLPTGAFYYPLHNDYEKGVPTFPYQKYCMNGVTINDVSNFFDQDDQVDFGHPKSPIIGVSLRTAKEVKGSGTFELKDSNQLVSENQLLRMMDYSEKVMACAISEILEGYIEPKPRKESCDYCNIKGFCPTKRLGQDIMRKMNTKVTKQTFEEVVQNEQNS